MGEADGLARLTVRRVGGDDGAVSIDYTTIAGSATEGLDYTALAGTLHWADGDDDNRFLDIPILEDAETENHETLRLRLSNPTGGATLGTISETLVTIVDDDVPTGLCVEDDRTLCLNDGRFQVQVDWRGFRDRTGVGHAIPFTADTGFFWFFSEDNLEVIIKVLDACGNPDFNRFWVFFAVASNVEYTITVTDTEHGVSRVYPNDLGVFAPATGDTAAFDTCP